MSSSLDLPQLFQMLAAQQGGSKGALDVSSALVNLLVGQGQSPSTQNQPQQNNARTTVASGMQEHAPRSSQQEAQAQAAESPLQHQLQKIIDQLQQQQDHLQNQLKHKQAQKQQLEQQQQVLLQQTQAGNLQQQQSEGDLDIRKLLFQALQGNNGLGTSAGTVGLNSMQQMTPQQSTSPDLNSLLALVGQGNNLGLAGLLQAANGSGPAPQPVASAPAMAAPGPALNLQNPALSAIVDLLLKQNHEASRQSSGAGGSLRGKQFGCLANLGFIVTPAILLTYTCLSHCFSYQQQTSCAKLRRNQRSKVMHQPHLLGQGQHRHQLRSQSLICS